MKCWNVYTFSVKQRAHSP